MVGMRNPDGVPFIFGAISHLIAGLNEKSCYSVREQQTQAIK